MSVQIKSMKVTCPLCGWFRIVPSQGDVAFAPSACARCGNVNITRSELSVFDQFNPISLMKRILKEVEG